jgi:signal transduction histidine kinase
LIGDLLDVASINRGRLRLEKTRVDLRAVLAHAIVLAESRIYQRRHSLETALPIEPVYVDGDAGRLAQIVANVLDNAAKYTPDGGRIWLTVRHSDTDVCITVRDSGMGIPAQHLGTIFEPFVQLEPQMLRSTSGLGLGLALVQTLTKMHGGSIVAISDGPGKGSQFEVRLPLAPPPAAA